MKGGGGNEDSSDCVVILSLLSICQGIRTTAGILVMNLGEFVGGKGGI